MNNNSKKKYDAMVKKRQEEGKRKLKAKKPWTPYVGYDDEITTSVWLGLVVSIKNALSLIKYLAAAHNYLYLMTRRLNQDSLEVCVPSKKENYVTHFRF